MALAASALSLVGLPQTAAVGHDWPQVGGRYVYTSGNFCVRGEGYQNHTYSGIVTYIEGPCSYVKSRSPSYIRHRSEYFKGWPGQPYYFCAYVPEKQNGTTTAALRTHVPRDVFWDGCNFGVGVWVDISMDTWHWSAYGSYWYPNWGGWPGIRPTTHHCHCP